MVKSHLNKVQGNGSVYKDTDAGSHALNSQVKQDDFCLDAQLFIGILLSKCLKSLGCSQICWLVSAFARP